MNQFFSISVQRTLSDVCQLLNLIVNRRRRCSFPSDVLDESARLTKLSIRNRYRRCINEFVAVPRSPACQRSPIAFSHFSLGSYKFVIEITVIHECTRYFECKTRFAFIGELMPPDRRKFASSAAVLLADAGRRQPMLRGLLVARPAATINHQATYNAY